MDPMHSHSFPGFAFLLVQVTYRFVPYGDTLLTFILLFLLLWGTAELIYRASHGRTRHETQPAERPWRQCTREK